MEQPRKRLSRFSDDPTGETLCVSPRDIAILRLLDPEYRYALLPSNWIHAFVGGDKTRLTKRLGALSRRPYKYLHRPEQQWTFNALYKHAVYSRGEGGERFLIEHGLLRRRSRRRLGHFRHELLNDLVDASIELGVRADPAMRLDGWQDILNHPQVPQSLKNSTDPFRIRIGDETLIPDGRPFVLRRNGAALCILGKEIDRNTEVLRPSELRATSIKRKFELYKQLFDHRLYHTHYGFPNAMVLIVTVNERHLRNMMDVAKGIMGGPCSYLLFKSVPDFVSLERSPQVTTMLLTNPWQRVGHSPFCFSALGEQAT